MSDNINLSFGLDGAEPISVLGTITPDAPLMLPLWPEGPCCASPDGERPYRLSATLYPRIDAAMRTPLLSKKQMAMADKAYRKAMEKKKHA